MDHSTAMMTGPEFRYRVKQSSMSLVQVSGLRDHGPHLSSGAEWELLDTYAANVVQRLHPYILRAPPIIQAMGERALFPVAAETLKATLANAIAEIAALGITRVAVLCASEAELETIKSATEGAKAKVKILPLWELYPKLKELEGEDPKGIGNAFLTAQLLNLRPEMVKTDNMKYADTSFGVQGDPKKATPEIGKTLYGQAFETLVAALDNFMRE